MQPRRADAFPRNGAAGPGCQAATVADGRRETKDRRAAVAEVGFVDAGRPSSGLQPAARMVAGFRLPSFRPHCIHEAHFRHRGASVSGALRPSATVAAWQPVPATPVPYRHPSLRSDVDLLSRCLRYHLPPA